MALGSDSIVKHVPSQTDRDKGDVCLNAEKLERKEEDTDLEDGEILDDDDDDNTSENLQQEVQHHSGQQDTKSDSWKAEAHASKASPSTEDSKFSRSTGEDDKESRKRHKSHKKRFHDSTENSDQQRESKRSKRSGESPKSSQSQPDDDEEMLFVRGASPTYNQSPSPPHEGYMGFGESGPYDYDSGDSSPERHYHGEAGGRTSKRKMRGSNGGRRGSSDRGGKNKRNERGRRARGGNEGGSSGGNRKRDNCMFYLQGKCQKGDDCPYMHVGTPPRKLEVCKFYVQGCCIKKEKCLYMHSDFPCKFFHITMNCRGNCLFSHEPLTEATKAILLKHIETAPKEILGEFPRPPRTNAGEDLPAEENGFRKIPSLFEIKVEPPAGVMPVSEASGSKRTKADNEDTEAPYKLQITLKSSGRLKANFYSSQSDEEETDEEDFDSQLRKRMEAQRLERERKSRENLETDAGTDPDNKEKLEEQIHEYNQVNQALQQGLPDFSYYNAVLKHHVECAKQQMQHMEEEQIKPDLNEVKVDPVEVKQEPENVEPEQKKEQDWQKLMPKEEPTQTHQSEALVAEDSESDDDEYQLVMATQEEEEDEQVQQQDGSEEEKEEEDEEETEDGVAIPKHLPKKQRELFLRIQQQQAQRVAIKAEEEEEEEAAETDTVVSSSQEQSELLDSVSTSTITEAPKSSPIKSEIDLNDSNSAEEQKCKYENWYSSDEEAEERSLADVLKNLSKQVTLPTQPSVTNYAAVSMPSTVTDSPPQDVPKPVTNHSSPVLENLNLAQISISADLTKLLSKIRSTAVNPQKQSPSLGPRDPRLSRDPRSRDTRVEAETKISSPTRSVKDIDLRLIPNSSKDLDLRTHTTTSSASTLVDTDLRQQQQQQQHCFGDTDLRNVSLLGLPFKPVPLHVPCTEIDASISSHPPVQYKLLPAHIRLPDYSDLKLNFSDPHVRNDPRLKKIVAIADATISPMSPPPNEVPRVDPRSRNDPRISSDPRLARMTSATVTSASTPLIPVNPITPPVPVIPVENALGLLMRPDAMTLCPSMVPMIQSQLPIINARRGLLENPIMGRAPGDGLLGPSPMHMLTEANLGLIADAQTQAQARQALLLTPPGIQPLPTHPIEDNSDDHNRTYNPNFRGRRSRGNNWERRTDGGGGRGRNRGGGGGGGGRSNWDRDRSNRRNRRDFDRHERSPNRHERGHSPSSHRRNRSFSPSRDERRRHSPAKESSKNHSPRKSPRNDAGSFTPPRGSSSFTPPQDNSGSFTPPHKS